jgi:hypothetical protein
LPTYHLRRNGSRVRWSAFVRGLTDSPDLRATVADALRNAEAAAYFFECAPWSAGSDPEVEWVLVPTRSFEGGTPDPSAFRDHFDPQRTVSVFPSLRGDAVLVVPRPMGDPAPYLHLASFVRDASPSQVDALLAAVGQALGERRRLHPATIWLSTAGLGVDWLHVRLDSRPKYYRHEPYRAGG